MDKRVGVLMGGISCERDISIKSGIAVFKALKNKGVNVAPIELAKSSSMNGYKESVIQKIRLSNIDVAFIALHGEFGEDGAIQEILEEINVPYTGSKVQASRRAIDKIDAKDIFKSNNIPTPRYIVIDKTDLDKGCNSHVYFKELGLPLVIKPCNEGSSIGLSIIDSDKDFYKAIEEAFNYSDRIIIEEYIKGREVTVGILEDKTLPVVEILPSKRFFDFEAKYQKGLTEYIVPAKISKSENNRCQEIALNSHKALGVRFFSRVDMILSQESVPYVLEVNTVPGLTETSLLPKAASAVGINFEQLILKILESALW